MKLKFVFILFVIFLSIQSSVFAQLSKPAIGANIGGGTISGQSPEIGSLSTGLFVQASPWFMEEYALRLGFNYSRKLEYFLPGNERSFFPFVQAFSLKLVLTQYSGEGKFFEESVGFVYLNDRTFSDVDTWSAGAVFNVQFGFDLRNEMRKGFTMGPNLEYAFTFSDISANMFSINLQSFYYF